MRFCWKQSAQGTHSEFFGSGQQIDTYHWNAECHDVESKGRNEHDDKDNPGVREHGCLNAGEQCQLTIECGCRHHQTPGTQWRAPPTRLSVINRGGVSVVDAGLMLL